MFFHFTQDASNGATGAFVAIESDERSKKRPNPSFLVTFALLLFTVGSSLMFSILVPVRQHHPANEEFLNPSKVYLFY